MYNGLTAVAYNLTDVNPGEGGLVAFQAVIRATTPSQQRCKI
jgi:hypothetical protein